MCNQTCRRNSSSWLSASHQHVKDSRHSGARSLAGVKGGFVSRVSYFLDLTVLSMAYGHIRATVVEKSCSFDLHLRTHSVNKLLTTAQQNRLSHNRRVKLEMLTPVDTVSQSLCQTWNADTSRQLKTTRGRIGHTATVRSCVCPQAANSCRVIPLCLAEALIEVAY